MSDHGAGAAAYGALRVDMRETAVLASAGAMLGWDQETFLPPRGSALRADQLAALSGLVHERATRPQVEEWLSAAEADEELRADAQAAANLREWRRDLDRARRLPPALVREMAQATALAQRAWRDAREASDFSAFAPWLEKVIELARTLHERAAPQLSERELEALAARPGATRRVNFETAVDVTIRYDMVEVQRSEIFVYPDIYGFKALHTEGVYQALLRAGYDIANVDHAEARRFVDSARGERAPVVARLDEVFSSEIVLAGS